MKTFPCLTLVLLGLAAPLALSAVETAKAPARRLNRSFNDGG